jgi:hypothetical protein
MCPIALFLKYRDLLPTQLNTPATMNKQALTLGTHPQQELLEPSLNLFTKADKAVSKTDEAAAPYLYADKMGIARLISMLFIVWGHSLLGWDKLRFKTIDYQFMQAVILGIGKIGTLSFFLITGYFLGGKIQNYTVPGFIKRRFFTLLLPWFIFLFLFVLVVFVEAFPYRSFQQINAGDTFKLLISLTGYSIYYSVYWFVPTSVISVIVLIVFKKYVNTIWFGVLLAFLTLFYCINLYFGWVAENHTKSVLAYIFFIWLGFQLKNNEHTVQLYLKRFSWPAILSAVMILYAVACCEGIGLMKSGSSDPFSTVRLTNIMVSLFIFLTLLKTEKLNWVNKLQPRKYVYGIYLVHCIVLNLFRKVLSQFVSNPIDINHLGKSMLLQASYFLIVFLFSYFIVFLLRGSKLKFVLGTS